MELVKDAAVAAAVVKDVSGLIKPLFENLRSSGANVTHPELRLKCPEQKMEYTAGIELKHKLLGGDSIRLKRRDMIHPWRDRLVDVRADCPSDVSVGRETHAD